MFITYFIKEYFYKYDIELVLKYFLIFMKFYKRLYAQIDL